MLNSTLLQAVGTVPVPYRTHWKTYHLERGAGDGLLPRSRAILDVVAVEANSEHQPQPIQITYRTMYMGRYRTVQGKVSGPYNWTGLTYLYLCSAS